jgi:ribosomal protein S18 acetylase RimI-like enzyme
VAAHHAAGGSLSADGEEQPVDESVGVRVARPEDYDGIVAVVDEWWGRSVSPSLPRVFLDHFWPTSRIVEDEHGLAAFLIALISPSQPRLAYVHFVGVRPDHRRGGLARGLYEDFARYAQEQGCTELQAITAPGNTGSIRFHQSLGFNVSGPVTDYNGPERPMVTFRHQLTAATDR